MKQPRPLNEMRHYAERLVDELRPVCTRIEVAGSIRRLKPLCSDIELVCVPSFHELANPDSLFAEPERMNALDEYVTTHPHFGYRLDKLGRVANGPRYKRLMVGDVALDLFSVLEPAQFGVIMVIRTGDADFSKRCVTPTPRGWLPSDCRVRDGAVWRGDEMIPMPEEEDFFRLLGRPVERPESRT